MNITDDQARDVVEGRRRFPPRPVRKTLTAQEAVDRAMQRFPKILAALHAAEIEEANRRLRINDNLTVRRSSDRIVATVSGPAIATATVGAVNVELSIEEARRMTDALSLLVGTAAADDVEVVG